jgi:hypothetical protein
MSVLVHIFGFFWALNDFTPVGRYRNVRIHSFTGILIANLQFEGYVENMC